MPAEVSWLHPGKAAEVQVNGRKVGVFGELHPLVREQFELGNAPVLVAEFDLDALRAEPPIYGIVPVYDFPPVYEDIAVIVDEAVEAARVEALIRQTGGRSLPRGPPVRSVSRRSDRRGEEIPRLQPDLSGRGQDPDRCRGRRHPQQDRPASGTGSRREVEELAAICHCEALRRRALQTVEQRSNLALFLRLLRRRPQGVSSQ